MTTSPDGTTVPHASNGSTVLADRLPQAAALVAGLWIALVVWQGLRGDIHACDLGMHAAAVGIGREYIAEGIWWPYVHEVHMGWDNYALYCWPLFVGMSLLARLLEACGAADPDWLSLMMVAMTACALLPAAAVHLATTLADELDADPQRRRAMAWGGLTGALAFLCLADDRYYGFGLATLNIGLIAQVVAWPLICCTLAACLRLLRPAELRSWNPIIRFSAVSCALFFVHPLSAVACAVIIMVAFAFRPRVWPRLGLAVLCCLLLAGWHLAIYMHHGLAGLPWPHEEHYYRDPWSYLVFYLQLQLSNGRLLSVLPMVTAVTGLLAWLMARPLKLRALAWGCGVLLLFSLEPALTQILPFSVHWYRCAAIVLLIGSCAGVALMAGWLAPRLERRDLRALALAGAFLLLILPPYAFPRWPLESGQRQDWAACIDDMRDLGLQRVLATDDGHDHARYAFRHRVDLAGGAHTLFAGPAWQWAAIAARGLPLRMFCLTYELSLEDRQQRLALLRDHGVQGLLYQRAATALPADQLVPPQERLTLRRHGPMRLIALRDPAPLLEALSAPPLVFAGPWNRTMRWGVSATWVRHLAAGRSERRLILVDDHDRDDFILRETGGREALGLLSRPPAFAGIDLRKGANRRLESQFDAIARDCAMIFASLPAVPRSEPTPRPQLLRDRRGMLLENLEPGRPYLLRAAFSRHLHSKQGALFMEGSGQIVVMPEQTRMRIVFQPFPAAFPWLLSIAILTGVAACGWPLVRRLRAGS